MQDRISRREAIGIIGAILAAPIAFKMLSSMGDVKEEESIPERDLKELLLTTTDGNNTYENRKAIAENLAGTANIRRLIEEGRLEWLSLGRDEVVGNQNTSELVMSIHKNGRQRIDTDGDAVRVGTQAGATADYDVTINQDYAPRVWMESLEQQGVLGEPVARGFRYHISKASLLNILSKILADDKCGEILGANFSSESVLTMSAVSPKIELNSVAQEYGGVEGVLKELWFEATEEHSLPHTEETRVLYREDEQTTSWAPILGSDGRLLGQPRFNSVAAWMEIELRPGYINNVVTTTFYNSGSPLFMRLDYGWAASIAGLGQSWIDRSPKVTGKDYTILEDSASALALSVFDSHPSIESTEV